MINSWQIVECERAWVYSQARGPKRSLEAEEPKDKVGSRAEETNSAQAGPDKCYECDIVRSPQ